MRHRFVSAPYAALAVVIALAACERESSTTAVTSVDAASMIAGEVRSPSLGETSRRELVAAELAHYDEHVVTWSAAELLPREKTMLAHLLRAAELVEELNMLQNHPQAISWRDELRRTGTPADVRLFERNQMPWCLEETSSQCSAFPVAPPRLVGETVWPAGMGAVELDAMRRAPNARDLLSPFAAVQRVTGGSWKVVPYASYPPFAARMKNIAIELVRAADSCDEPTLRKFLFSRAAAFTSTTLFPFDASDYDWIALSGSWEVTIGPYQTDADPNQLKARFMAVIGRVDQDINQQIEVLRGNLQSMEDALAQLVGRSLYRARRLDPRVAIRAVEVLVAAGDARKYGGALGAYHLPVRGAAVDDGLYKTVLLVNHTESFQPIVAARARLILEPELQQLPNGRANTLNTVFHELAHGLGAYDEFEVVGYDRKHTTVQAALREYAELIEELKAEVLALWFIGVQQRQGAISDEQARRRYVSGLMHLLGLMNYPLSESHPRLAAIQLQAYLLAGALTFEADQHRWHVDFARLSGAIEVLARRVATVQITGNYTGAQSLVRSVLLEQPDGSLFLAAPLRDAVAITKATFAAARVRSISLHYTVTGL